MWEEIPKVECRHRMTEGDPVCVCACLCARLCVSTYECMYKGAQKVVETPGGILIVLTKQKF